MDMNAFPPFNHTMHYSAFNGSLNAYLPLIAAVWLEDQGPFTEECFPMPGVIKNAAQAGYYPTEYCVSVEEEVVHVELREFEYKTGRVVVFLWV